MSRRPFAAVVFAVLTFFAAAGAAGEGPPPRWPLDLGDRHLTSDFMEHRDGRFHAGIDLKTRSRVGYPVHAAEDGFVVRLKTSAGGYGRALYLRGESGRTWVYAHLQRFRDDIAARVRKARDLAGGGYAIDLALRPEEFPVARGDVLALSGQSGTLGPHLHLEVRDRRQRPLNPQREGLPVGDVLPPRLLRVRAHPASPRSRVMGTPFAHSISAEPTLSGLLPPVAVRGPVAFSVAVVDASDVSGHRLEPYRLTLLLDGEVVFEARNDRLAFDHNGQMRYEWLERDDGPRERWLWLHPDNRVAGRRADGWGPHAPAPAAGRHRLTLQVADAEGNVVSAGWDLWQRLDAPPDSAAAAATGPAWALDPARVAVPAGDSERAWLTPFLLVREAGRDSFTVVAASTVGGDAPWRVQVADSLSAAEIRAAAERQGLAPAGWAGRCLAADWPSPAAADIELRLDPSLPVADDAALYRQDDRGLWRLVGPCVAAAESGLWRAEVTGPGRYALLRDTCAPYLGPGPFEGVVRPDTVAGRPGFAARRWQDVTLRLEDIGSGVDPATLAVRLDGEPCFAEPDPPRHRVLVRLPDATQPGLHRLEVSAGDLAGRVARRGYDLRITP